MNDEYLIEKEEYKGYVIKLIQDTDGMNPRDKDFDEGIISKMVCFHKRYDLGDENEHKSNDFNGWDDIEQHLIKEHDAFIILPLYLYDHSGITMRTYSFNDRWDSGQVGFIYISEEKVRKEYSAKHITKTLIEKITKYLESEVSTYNNYLTGNVCGFIVEDEEGENLDSCWGFYGDDGRKEAMSEAKNIVDNLHERWVEKLIDAKVIEIKEEVKV
jgi:hypothetical protein